MRRHICIASVWMLKMAAGAWAGEPIAEAELHEHVTAAFANPNKASALPRVLIIGDSISIGYTEQVRLSLKDVAHVFRPPANCQHTAYGLAHIKAWLGTKKWDVIHFNFGIWDTHLLDANGNLFRAEGEQALTPDLRQRHTPDQYRENLTRIVEILEGTGARLIWASTTPVMRRTGARAEAIPILNRTAEELMRSRGIAVNDLHAFVLPHAKAWQSPDRVHFNALGNTHLGERVSERIRLALERKAP